MPRNLQKEQDAIGLFGQKHGRMPNLENQDDRREVYEKAYGTNLPAELQGTIEESTSAGGLNVPEIQSEYADTSRINELGGNVEQAQKRGMQMAQPNQALRIFQEALRKKTGIGNQPMGKSKIYESAGISGMGALQNSLSARQKEMQINQTEYNNLVGQMAGHYKDRMIQNQMNYNRAYDLYEMEMKRINELENFARGIEAEKDMMKMEYDLKTNLATLKNSLKKQSSQSGFVETEIQRIIENNPDLTEPQLYYKLKLAKERNDWDVPDGLLSSAIKNRYSNKIFGQSTPQGENQTTGVSDTIFSRMAGQADTGPKVGLERAREFAMKNQDEENLGYKLRVESDRQGWKLSEGDIKEVQRQASQVTSTMEEVIQNYTDMIQKIKQEYKQYMDEELTIKKTKEIIENNLKSSEGDEDPKLGAEQGLEDLGWKEKYMFENALKNVFGEAPGWFGEHEPYIK